MLIRIMRRVSLSEVSNRVQELEDMYPRGFDAFLDELERGQIDRKQFNDYVEWMRMVHAIGAYREGEDFEYYNEETLEMAPSEISKLTPKRIILLNQLSKLRPRSINDLATKTSRNVKNIYDDLKTLEDLGFVSLVRYGRSTIPELLVQEVTFLLE